METTLGHPCRSDRIPPLPAAKCGVDPYHHKSLLPRPPGGIDRRGAVLADQLPGAPLRSKLHLQRGDRLIQRSGIPHILQALVLKRNPKRVTENHPTPKRIIYYALYGFMGPGDLPHHILIVRMLLQSKSDFSAPNPPKSKIYQKEWNSSGSKQTLLVVQSSEMICSSCSVFRLLETIGLLTSGTVQNLPTPKNTISMKSKSNFCHKRRAKSRRI